MGVFAIIYQIMLGWKTCKYYHETHELPNPRKIGPKVAFGPLFPAANKFSWVGTDFIWETDCPTQPDSPQTPNYVDWDRDRLAIPG